MPSYKVIAKAFVNGTLYQPGAIIENARAGLEGKALKLIGDDAPAIGLPVPPPDQSPPGDPPTVPNIEPQPVVPDPNTPPPSQAKRT